MREAFAEPVVDFSPALTIADVTSGYGELMVLHDVSFNVAPGSIVSLLGKNGMGKTTLLKSVMGYLPKKRGAILIGGQDVTNTPAYRVARQGVSYTPQEQALFADLSILDNLRLSLKKDSLLPDRLDDIYEIFPFLKDRMQQYAGTLSGGEQKMLLVARALLSRPALMLIDEITEGLQPSVIERVAEALKRERTNHGTAILLVEQNVEFALNVADHYVVLKRGEIVTQGSTKVSGAAEQIRTHLQI